MKKRNPLFGKFKGKFKGLQGLLYIFSGMFLALLVLIGACFRLLKPDDWDNLLIGLMGDLISAIVIGLFFGLITKIITTRLFSVQVNMKKMQEAGVDSVGGGLSEEEDIEKMFGHGMLKKVYPKQLKLLFLTGNGFLRAFDKKIIRALDEGCEVRLMIASSDEKNGGYLTRCSDIYHRGKVDYVDEIENDSLKTVKSILQKTRNPQNFKVRFFLDEYQNNIRVAKYEQPKKISYYWINLQPMNKPAIDLSLAVKGSIEEDQSQVFKTDENNLCAAFEASFDFLWEKYKDTQRSFEV